MEQEPKHNTTTEQYKDLLEIKFANVDKQDFEKHGVIVFLVSPEYTIYISKVSHFHIAEKHGAKLDESLTEGYIRILKDGSYEVKFKSDYYQWRNKFTGSDKELENFKAAVHQKLSELIAEVKSS